MGTRGSYGFRKNGVDKLTYNHFDSYPSWLGRTVIEFCKNNTIDEMNEVYDNIFMVDRNSIPTELQIKECIENGFADFSVSTQKNTDWYCLLRNCQGNLECLKNIKPNSFAYMINNSDFIKDSLWCEYAYIINLDDEVLEFYKGFQKEPQEENRYGTEKNDGYYPCKLCLTVPLNEIEDIDKIIEMMESDEEDN